MTFQIDLRAVTPVVPLHSRNQQAVVGGEDEGPGAGLVEHRDDCKQVRPNHFRGGSGCYSTPRLHLQGDWIVQLTHLEAQN